MMIRWPAEWEQHERTLMGWPCRTELWGETIQAAKAEYAGVANAIADHEPVTMIAANPRDAAEARAACGGNVEILQLPMNDSWLRDSGPIFVYEEEDATRPAVATEDEAPSAHRAARVFRFNGWGEKFVPYDDDARLGAELAERFATTRQDVEMVLEGGSVIGDSMGTLYTTEQCLLHPSRNPQLTREQIESRLLRAFGAREVVWLGQGLVEDRDTDGHIDLIAAHSPVGGILLQGAPEDNPNHANCVENRERLVRAGEAVTEMPHLPYAEVVGERVAVSYMNLYVCNGAVIVPVSGAETDEDALAIIGRAFPGTDIVPVSGVTLAYGGGGPHCITQQVPEDPWRNS